MLRIDHGVRHPVRSARPASFQLGNYNPPFTDAPVFDAQGNALAGSDYHAELWGGATPDALAPLVVIFEGNRREIVPFLTDGYFASALARFRFSQYQ